MTSRTRNGDATAIPAVIVGTSIWFVALLTVSITSGTGIPDSGVWWWGVCCVGSASGVIGLAFLYWRRARMIRSGRLS